MSTTYYIYKKLPEEVKAEIKNLMDADDYANAVILFDENTKKTDLGHRAGGWKFSWNPYCLFLKELSREGIREMVLDKDYVIIDEYSDIIDNEEFLDMAFGWDDNNTCTSDVYIKEHPELEPWDMSPRQDCLNLYLSKTFGIDVKFPSRYSYDFIKDDLRWSIS